MPTILEPTANPWRRMWRSWPWWLVMRGLMPAASFTAGAAAFTNLRAHLRVGGKAWPPSKPVLVLAVELVASPLLGFFLLGGTFDAATWSAAVNRFFMTQLAGCGLFTTLES